MKTPAQSQSSPPLYVVTGASSGIGRALAILLLNEGQSVLAVGRSTEKLESLKIEANGSSNLFTLAVDLTSDSAPTEVAKAVRSTGRVLKGLVNNAGIYQRMLVAETTDAHWQEQFEGNFFASVRLIRALGPLLQDAAPSSILNVSSTLGVRSIAGTAAYSAAKAALVSLTQTLALEWASRQVRVNCICPGLVDTPIHGEKIYGAEDKSPARMAAHRSQPLGRMGTAHEIAEACWFLLSEKSSWTTGAIFRVDGGISL